MCRKVKQLKSYTTAQVEALFESDKNNIVGVKLHAIIQLTRGYSTRKLEGFYRVTHKQICNWADRLDAEGLEGLRDKPGSGHPSRLTSDQQEHLRTILLRSPDELGYNTASCSAPLVRDYIQKQYQVEYKQANIYTYFISWGSATSEPRAFTPKGTRLSVRQPKRI